MTRATIKCLAITFLILFFTLPSTAPFVWSQTNPAPETTWNDLEARIAKIDRRPLIAWIKKLETDIRAVIPVGSLILSPEQTKLYRDFKNNFRGKKTPAEKLAYVTEFTQSLGDDLDMDGDYSLPVRVLIYPDPMLRNQRVAHLLGKKLDSLHRWPQSTWSADKNEMQHYQDLCDRSMHGSSLTFCAGYYCCDVSLDDDRFFPDATFSPNIVAWSTASDANIIFELGKWLQFHAITEEHGARFYDDLYKSAFALRVADRWSFLAFVIDLDLQLEQLHLSDNPSDEELSAALQAGFDILLWLSRISSTIKDINYEAEFKEFLKTPYVNLANSYVQGYLEALINRTNWVRLFNSIIESESTETILQQLNDNRDIAMFGLFFSNPARLLRHYADLTGGNPLDGSRYSQPIIMILPIDMPPASTASSTSTPNK